MLSYFYNFIPQFIEANEKIYTDGCVQKIIDVAEDNMLIIGGITIGLAIPQVSFLVVD